MKNNKIIIINFILINLRAFISTRIPNSIAILTKALGSHQPFDNIKSVFLWALLVVFFNFLLRIINTITDNYTTVQIDKDLSSLIYNYTMNQSAEYRSQIPSVKFNINANNFLRFSKAWTKFNRLLYLFVELLICLYLLYSCKDKSIAIFTGIFIATYIIFFYIIMGYNQKLTDYSIRTWNSLNQFITNTFQYLNIIHLFNKNHHHTQQFTHCLDEANSSKLSMLSMKTFIVGFVEFSFNIYQYLLLWIIILNIYKGDGDIGMFTLVSILCHRTYHHVKEIVSEYKMIEDFSIAMESMKNLFKSNNQQEIINPLKTSINPKKYDITINNLLFKKEEECVILDIKKLKFQQNKAYVILGSSGCGKTSLVNLLAGLYSYEGTIKLDKYDIKDFNTNELRKYIHLIIQDNGLLPISIADNISYSNENSTMETIIEAAKNACIHDMIMDLPHQYNTILDDNCMLSTGQKQRIILARIFASSAKIIIIDEGTSSLDLVTESTVYYNMKKHLKDKTLIIIAHRLGVLDYFDNVIFIEKGSIQCQGDHNQLLNNDHNYNKFILDFNKMN